MVRWKYDKIMKGEYRFEYKPMYELTLEKMKTNEGEESVMFNEMEKENLEESKVSGVKVSEVKEG